MLVTCFTPILYIITNNNNNTLLKTIKETPKGVILYLLCCDLTYILLWHWMPMLHIFKGPKPEVKVCLHAGWPIENVFICSQQFTDRPPRHSQRYSDHFEVPRCLAELTLVQYSWSRAMPNLSNGTFCISASNDTTLSLSNMMP